MSDDRPADDQKTENIDLTSDTYSDDSSFPEYVEQDYDPRPREDVARIIIAVSLVALFVFVIVWFVVVGTINVDKEPVIHNLLQLILSPLVALVSAATGFYFGSKK